jgi:hypothetical protein
MRITISLLFTILILSTFGTGSLAKKIDKKIKIKKRLIILYTSNIKVDEYKKTVKAIKAQTVDLPVILKVIWIEPKKNRTTLDRIKIARRTVLRTDATGVIFCNFKPENKIFIYLSEPLAGKILERDIGKDELGGKYEALALILRSSIKSILEEFKFTKKTNIKMKPHKSMGFSKKQKKIQGLSIGSSFTTMGFSKNNYFVKGIHTYVSLTPFKYLNINAGFTFFEKIYENNERVKIEIQKNPLYLGLGIPLKRGKFYFEFSFFSILDFISLKSNTEFSGYSLTGHLNFSISTGFTMGYEVFNNFYLTLKLSMDLLLYRQYYVNITSDINSGDTLEEEFIAKPLLFQPNIFLGFIYKIL